MLNPFKRKANTPTKEPLQSMKVVEFNIEGMHCVSCAMTIDGELEDTQGVKSATTQYAQACSSICFDPTKVDESKLVQVVESLGYQVKK